MDPNKNLEQQLELSKEIIQDAYDPLDGKRSSEKAFQLAELVISLDAWVKNGGFLPSAWMKK